MKYIFCIIALLIQPVFSWYVYHKQDKRQAALKMPMVYFSAVYLVAQMYVFFKFCSKIPENYQIYSYLIQGAILAAFLLLEIFLFAGNQYINRIQEQEQESIRDFKSLIKELEICRLDVADAENQKCIEKVYEKMRYSDPVSSKDVAAENCKIHELIMELSEITEQEEFSKKCREIEKWIEIRKIKNTKEQG